jgi:hypothetical protein
LGEDLDLGEAEGEEAEEGEEDAEGVGEDFVLAGEEEGLAEGVGDGSFCRGFTGPVGLRGGPGFGVGVGVGEGAAQRSESPRQSGSAKMKRRNLMGASCGPPTLDDALRVAKNFRMGDHRPRSDTIFSR